MPSIIVSPAAVTLASGAATAIISDESILVQSIHLNAPATNAGALYFGDSNVSSTRYMFKLEPGEEGDLDGNTVVGTYDDIDLSSLFVRGTAADVLIFGYQKRSN